jgi:hypothetical protein
MRLLAHLLMKLFVLIVQSSVSYLFEMTIKQVKNVSEILDNMHISKEEFHSLFEKSNNLGDGILELTEW